MSNWWRPELPEPYDVLLSIDQMTTVATVRRWDVAFTEPTIRHGVELTEALKDEVTIEHA